MEWTGKRKLFYQHSWTIGVWSPTNETCQITRNRNRRDHVRFAGETGLAGNSAEKLCLRLFKEHCYFTFFERCTL